MLKFRDTQASSSYVWGEKNTPSYEWKQDKDILHKQMFFKNPTHIHIFRKKINGAAAIENSIVIPQKIKNRIISMIQQFHFWAHITKELKVESWRDICTLVFTAALFIIANRWKQFKCPLTDGWRKWSIYIQ